jgi:hypothetical protein
LVVGGTPSSAPTPRSEKVPLVPVAGALALVGGIVLLLPKRQID